MRTSTYSHMNNFFTNFLKNKNIAVNPVMLKIIFEWGFSLFIAIGGGAYAWGVHKSNKNNDKIEQKIENLQATVISYHQDDVVNYQNLKSSIKKVYNDGYELYNNNQKFEQRQFNLLIDYGTSNKSLLKQILKDNQEQKNEDVLNYVERSKSSIDTAESINKKNGKNIIIGRKLSSTINIININGNDTTFMITDVDINYIDNVLKSKYNIKEIKPININKLFNVIYRRK